MRRVPRVEGGDQRAGINQDLSHSDPFSVPRRVPTA
jgi:hypothetical protein